MVAYVPATHARGGWGLRPPPLAELSPRLPPTRRWPVDDRAHHPRPYAATGGGHGRGVFDRGSSHRHGHVTFPPLRRRRSRARAAAAAGRRAPPRPLALGCHGAADGGASDGFGSPSLRRGARPGLGHAGPCPPLRMVVTPAGGRPPSTPRMCVRWAKPLLASLTVAGTSGSAPPHSAWQQQRARVSSPADRWGGGFRSGAPRAAPRTEAPRVCSHGRSSSGAPPTPHARG